MNLIPFLVQFCCLSVTWESINLQLYRPRKFIIIDLFWLFLNAGGGGAQLWFAVMSVTALVLVLSTVDKWS